MKLPKESKLREDFASRKVFKKNLSFNLCLKQVGATKRSLQFHSEKPQQFDWIARCSRIFLKKISPELDLRLPAHQSLEQFTSSIERPFTSEKVDWMKLMDNFCADSVPNCLRVSLETQCLTLESVANVINCTPTWNFCFEHKTSIDGSSGTVDGPTLETKKWLKWICLVVEPTHLKNMSQIGNLPPKNRGENKKYLKPPPRFNGVLTCSFTSLETNFPLVSPSSHEVVLSPAHCAGFALESQPCLAI